MKVNIGKYKTWVGPYQLADMVFFWQDKYSDTCRWAQCAHKFGHWLAHKRDGSSSTLLKLCEWVQSKRQRVISVKIEPHDTWSMDSTLGLIVLPMLQQLRASKHGAPFTDDEDVPEHLKSTSAPPKENEYDTDANHFLRWDWVLDEMIFAFTCKLDDSWQDKYRTGTIDIEWKPSEQLDSKGKPLAYEMAHGPKDTYECDYDGMQIEQTRITNGFRLFGKYYENLWD